MNKLALNNCFILFVFSVLIIAACNSNILAQSSKQNTWSVKFNGIGIFSSPRVTDLNGDGVGDIIFGAGREEFHACDSSVIALNGLNGEILWTVPSIDHTFSSPALKDITGDSVDDVIIGGRSAELMLINGRTGKVIWKFDKTKGGIKWYNFYNPQFIRDQDGDNIEEILISNGGNVLAEPHDTKNRYPGNLVILSGKNGKMISRAPMPDGKEIYMSVVALPLADGKNYQIVFGTGGETIGGNLFVTTLSDVLKGDISNSILLDSSPRNGYIGPPVLTDISNDGIPDIIANAVEGKLMAFDGRTYKPIWTVKMPNTEAYTSIAPGYFTGNDTVPDFFVSYAVGTWPDLGWSKQFMVDGTNGKIAYLDSLGSYQTSTPVVIDLDGDGLDEAILNVNTISVDDFEMKTFQNILIIIDFKANEALQFWDGHPGSNLSSTPWIGDMDKDNKLDIVYCHGTNTKKTYTFDGLQVNRIATDIPIKSEIYWGAYMGSTYTGILKRK
jgi:outer membrane protein assembly factor BamB